MCGIVGAISQRVSLDQVEAATAALGHRGPDNVGCGRYGQVWLGHTRLAINDLSSAANQPFVDPKNDCVVVFNGEIYNYRELRNNLKSNYSFRTDSEVEVIACLYAEYGEDFVRNLDGMFAFAILDRRNKRLFMARDRIGKKPLFYWVSESQQELFFASELKAFRCFPITLSLDSRILDNVLNFTHFRGESIVQDIHALLPGESMLVDLSEFSIKKKRYFDLIDLIDEEEYGRWSEMGLGGAVQELGCHLESAVTKRLISDVPVAIIASGGLDSSLVSVFANRKSTYDLLHIDSVDSSEYKYAKLLAGRLHVKLESRELGYKAFEKHIHETIDHWEYPLVHTNATGILMVAALARDLGYKVLLGGEGADELFAGYPAHRLYGKALLLNILFRFVPNRLIQALFFARSDTKGAGMEPSIQHISNVLEYKRYYKHYHFIRSERERRLQAFLATELKEYLLPLLSRADRMTMAMGVEMRLPFLDLEVIRSALNMPMAYKLRGNKQKIVLRKLGERELPREVLDKPKVGFTVDYAQRFIEENGITECPNLNRYFDSQEVIAHLMSKGQYHKVLRLYSVDHLFANLI